MFLDSFPFMSSSLDSLVRNLPGDALRHSGEVFQGTQLKLMKKNGTYPFDHMDSTTRFKEAELPPQEAFYSILNVEHLSDEAYQHAKNVWSAFSLKTMGDYHDLYLKSDVLLLADVFENFRRTCRQCYKLDSCHYFTSSVLAWDAI